MRKTAISIALLLLALGEPARASHSGFREHEFTADIISSDSTQNTITFLAEGDNLGSTLPVSGKALEKIKSLSAGDRVTLTCLDDDDGQHLGIINVKK